MVRLLHRPTLLMVGLADCRLGGPTSNPDDYTPARDIAMDATSASMASSSSGDGIPTPRADDASGDDGGDAHPNLDAPDAFCSSTITVAVCDPVRNTGCNPFQQCDIDPTQGTTPTGLCVFGGAAEGGTCSASFFTETCAPKSTCVDGGCRALCFCDRDCPARQCCSDTAGSSTFKLCSPCSP